MAYNVVVSIGNSCLASWTCKKAGLKRFSCPFDWIFTGVDVIIDCLTTDFQVFLDKEQYDTYLDTQKSAIHKKYGRIFLHHDPRLTEDYEYFQRCVNRFKQVCRSETLKVMFLMTYYNKSRDEIPFVIQDVKRMLDVLPNFVQCRYTLVVMIHTIDEVDPIYENTIDENFVCRVFYMNETLRGLVFDNNSYNTIFTNYLSNNFEYALIDQVPT
jgi:hypothetical protein